MPLWMWAPRCTTLPLSSWMGSWQGAWNARPRATPASCCQHRQARGAGAWPGWAFVSRACPALPSVVTGFRVVGNSSPSLFVCRPKRWWHGAAGHRRRGNWRLHNLLRLRPPVSVGFPVSHGCHALAHALPALAARFVQAMGRNNFGCNVESWDFKGLQSKNVTLNGAAG